MSDQKIIQLQRDTGCDVALAKLMLKFTAGDVDGALNIIKSVEKNIFVFRLKFIAQTSKIYGTLSFIFNTKTKTIDKLYCVVKREDKTAIEFDFEKTWNITFEEIISYYQNNIIDIELQNKILSAINTNKTVSLLENKLTTKKEIDENSIKNYFTDILINISGDVSVAVKSKIDKTDIFEINRGSLTDTENDTTKEDLKKEEIKKEKDQDQILLLNIEMDLAPVDGVQISELQIGDLIGVKITDDRPIAEYICTLLNAKDPVTKQPLTLFAELKDIKVTESGIVVRVEFGPGIHGVAHYGEDVKIRVTDKEDLFNKSKKEDSSKGNFFFKYFWLIGGGLILIIVVILILLMSNN